VEDKTGRGFEQRRVAQVAELATVAEMVAVEQAGRGGRDENHQQASQRESGRDADGETPE
jgi:hypothetical protein